MKTTVISAKKHMPSLLLVACILAFWPLHVLRAETVAGTALADMPIREITVFKDGHVFVLHQGNVPTDPQGNVVLDYLPRPVLGTFWAYSADPKTKLSSVVSGRRIVSLDRTSLSVRELIEGNPGTKVRIKEQNQPQPYQATILSIPQRSTEELGKTTPPGTEDMLPQKGGIVLLKTEEGIKAVPLERIEEVTFLDDPKSSVPQQEFRNLMTLKLDWPSRKPQPFADVGMVYVQRGIRWIPNYRIDLDGNGNAVVKLQATILNELADVEDVTANLVIGVPTFAFKDQVDPISLQETVARLSSSFQADSRTAFALSNSIMSQVPASDESRAESSSSGGIDLGPEVTGSIKSEDLYIFTVQHITLKKGQRMVIPITEFKLKYKDVYALDLPFGPPPEVRRNLDGRQQAEIAKLFAAPKVMHKIRLENDSKYPVTTAPALIFRQGRIIAQGMTCYTAVGGSGDLDLTVAVDIRAEKLDKETGFEPDAEVWNGDRYGRRDLAGKITLTNRRDDKVYLEITRSVLGFVDTAGSNSFIEHLDRSEGTWMTSDVTPSWWSWYNWPHWWYYYNTVGRITWKLELEPKKSIDLEYTWHYFWRQ